MIGYASGRREGSKKGKTKKKYRPNFTRCDAGRNGKDAGGYPGKKEMRLDVIVWSSSIRSSSGTPRVRCSR